jgi:hypothetical protein
VRLKYTTTRWDGERRESDYWIQLETTPQPFGGRRWRFVCPRTGRRAAKLYLPNGAFTFASRQAYRLAYRSQREAPHDRALRRAFKCEASSGRTAASATMSPSRSRCAGQPTTGSSRKSSPPRKSSTRICWGSSRNSIAVWGDEAIYSRDRMRYRTGHERCCPGEDRCSGLASAAIVPVEDPVVSILARQRWATGIRGDQGRRTFQIAFSLAT